MMPFIIHQPSAIRVHIALVANANDWNQRAIVIHNGYRIAISIRSVEKMLHKNFFLIQARDLVDGTDLDESSLHVLR